MCPIVAVRQTPLDSKNAAGVNVFGLVEPEFREVFMGWTFEKDSHRRALL
jgi:hypothetical protein